MPMSAIPISWMSNSEPAWDVALLYPPQGKWSVDDYLDLTDNLNQFVEFSGGRIEVLAVPTVAHQRILVYLFSVLKGFVDQHGLGEVLPSVLRVRVADDRFREPDIAFKGRRQDSSAEDRYWESADLVVEIVSDDRESRERDHVKKRLDYAAAGIAEYWIIDPQDKRITVLALEDGAYTALGEFGPGEQAHSKLLQGLAVDVAATFQAAEA
jgi:Uma2 family endonuclease